LIVSIFRVIEPNLSNFSFFAGQGIGEVVENAEIFTEIAKFFIGFAPDEAVSA
jgi:hypothetical protein